MNKFNLFFCLSILLFYFKDAVDALFGFRDMSRILLIGLLFFGTAFHLKAQESLDIPTDSLISVQIVSVDSNSLEAYYCYEIRYQEEEATLLVLKSNNKPLLSLGDTSLTLCRVKRFYVNGVCFVGHALGNGVYNSGNNRFYNFDTKKEHAYLNICEP